MKFKNVWRNLSLSTKLYFIVSIMLLSVLANLLLLNFAVRMLAASRAGVAAEGIWLGAHKDAVVALKNFIRSGDPQFYRSFEKIMEVPLGAQQALVAFEKVPRDLVGVQNGLIQAKIHPYDIENLIQLTEALDYGFYVKKSFSLWKEGTQVGSELFALGQKIYRTRVTRSFTPMEREVLSVKIDGLNQRLNQLGKSFSDTLGDGAR